MREFKNYISITTKEEIKSCPICTRPTQSILSGLGCYLYCDKCGIESPRTGHIKDALAVWNDELWRENIIKKHQFKSWRENIIKKHQFKSEVEEIADKTDIDNM